MKEEKNKVSSLFKPPVVYKDSLRDQYSKMLKIKLHLTYFISE